MFLVDAYLVDRRRLLRFQLILSALFAALAVGALVQRYSPGPTGLVLLADSDRNLGSTSIGNMTLHASFEHETLPLSILIDEQWLGCRAWAVAAPVVLLLVACLRYLAFPARLLLRDVAAPEDGEEAESRWTHLSVCAWILSACLSILVIASWIGIYVSSSSDAEDGMMTNGIIVTELGSVCLLRGHSLYVPVEGLALALALVQTAGDLVLLICLVIARGKLVSAVSDASMAALVVAKSSQAQPTGQSSSRSRTGRSSRGSVSSRNPRSSGIRSRSGQRTPRSRTVAESLESQSEAGADADLDDSDGGESSGTDAPAAVLDTVPVFRPPIDDGTDDLESGNADSSDSDKAEPKPFLLIAGGLTQQHNQQLDQLASSAGVEILATLCSDEELDAMGMENFAEKCEAANLFPFAFPVARCGLPTQRLADFVAFVRALASDANQGTSILLHARNLRGRAALVAACTLLVGVEDCSVAQAVHQVRRAAGSRALRNPLQLLYVNEFARSWRYAEARAAAARRAARRLRSRRRLKKSSSSASAQPDAADEESFVTQVLPNHAAGSARALRRVQEARLRARLRELGIRSSSAIRSSRSPTVAGVAHASITVASSSGQHSNRSSLGSAVSAAGSSAGSGLGPAAAAHSLAVGSSSSSGSRSHRLSLPPSFAGSRRSPAGSQTMGRYPVDDMLVGLSGIGGGGGGSFSFGMPAPPSLAASRRPTGSSTTRVSASIPPPLSDGYGSDGSQRASSIELSTVSPPPPNSDAAAPEEDSGSQSTPGRHTPRHHRRSRVLVTGSTGKEGSDGTSSSKGGKGGRKSARPRSRRSKSVSSQ